MENSRRICTGLLLGAALASLSVGELTSATRPQSATHRSDSLAVRIEAFLAPYVTTRNFSGVVLVARRDSVLLEAGLGRADFARDVATQPDHRFCIGSVSKSFTAAAVLSLVEQGKVDLDDPISSHLPGFPHGERITVQHLLEHRSGLPNLFFDPAYADLAVQHYERPAHVVDLVRGEDLTFEPGSQYAYNNLNYVALAWLIEAVAATRYLDFLESELLAPLGLTNVGLIGSSTDSIPGLAKGHDPVGVDELRRERHSDRSILVGAGSTYSTARDLWTWYHAVAHRRLLATLPDSIVFDYLGQRQELSDHPALVATGWDGIGYAAHVIYLRDEHLAVVVVSNLNIATVVGEIAEGVAAIALGEQPTVTPLSTRQLPQDSLIALAGRYRFGDDFYVPNGVLDLVARDGRLFDRSRDPEAALLPLMDNGFLYRPVWARIRFQRDADGRVTRLTFYDRFEAKKERGDR
jgi:CubicO group peptidase (beta-lactamase class C family)